MTNRHNNELPFFVYGTLRRDQHNYERYFNNKTEKEKTAWIKGSLYNYGNLPAYLPQGETWIRGDLIYIKPKYYQEVLTEVDFLEGYEPSSEGTSLYLRRNHKVTTENDEKVEAWIYIFNYPVSEKLMTKIDSGDWNSPLE
ncbi:gamma-glutamylcyclotransferase family protein [Natranaerofaba carboxydovora]|uniref:gamma-glutamylcyclotransferase family protein n=1 Tax=Natranaerofaba carboxydovora TaxID=2742683 RepID=UPI001F12A1F5|nr:gamma-glutamylcyclotransferase family protein [Natranaerofaba carboxydovora]UMZ73802.1 Gamma-glutamyl cyclotransferase, AIG2-like [Natranaerofaba carboxydovora]